MVELQKWRFKICLSALALLHFKVAMPTMRELVGERCSVPSGMYITPCFLTCKKADRFPSVEDLILSSVLVPGRWWTRVRWNRTFTYLYGVL